MIRHYEVVSPEYLVGRSYDPPDPGEYNACYVMVKAETPSKAKAAALRSDDFSEWRRHCDDNPFRGVTVRLSRCEHGICYCDDCATECPECEKNMAEHLASGGYE